MELLKIISNLWRRPPRKLGNDYFYGISGRGAKSLDYLEAFNCLPEVNAVINLSARCLSSGKIKIVDKTAKEVAHQYTTLLQDPNWFQPISEFMRQTKIFHDVYGNEFLFMLRPIGMNIVKGLFTLPPNLVECEYLDKQPFFLFNDIPEVKYSIKLANNQKMTLAHEDIIHLNDNRVSISSAMDKNLLLGESKLKSLAPVISNLFRAYESRGVIMHRRGAVGIISNENKDAIGSTIPLGDDEKKDVQEGFSNYGLRPDQYQYILTSLPLKWQPIELDPRKLGLFEETAEDFSKIMDAFGIPQEMFVRTEGATYENQNQARKSLYENSVIPEAQEWIGAINQSLFEDDTAKAIVDYSHLPIFQEDLKVTTDIMNTRVSYLSRLLADNAISIEEYREELFKVGIGNGKPVRSGISNKNHVLNGKPKPELAYDDN